MSLYNVVGNPVEHSKSPYIHQLFAAQTGEDLEYRAVKVEADNFDNFVKEFFIDKGAGLNITVPFKEAAYRLAERHGEHAALARSVNTLYLDDAGTLCGENTDGIGLVRDIQDNNGFSIRERRVLLLGAGGAARGALSELINHQPSSIVLLNRTLSKAQQLKEEFGGLAEVESFCYENFSATGFDLIINATSLSLSGELPPLNRNALQPGCCCYDMMYGVEATVFVRWAKGNGVVLALDGLGMLVEQAAESFSIWRGKKPDTGPVISILREQSKME